MAQQRAQVAMLVVAAFVALAAPCAVRADDTPPPRRRELPDYDGRPDREPDEVDALLWIPRLLTAPLHIVTEYLLRRPLGWLMTELERADVFTFLLDLFTFGEERQIGVFPTAFYDFGLSPSVGVYAYWHDLLVRGNHLSLHAATWGPEWLSLVAADRLTPRPDVSAGLRVEAVQRPDHIFGGIGWTATNDQRARFGRGIFDVSAYFEQRPWRRSGLVYVVGYRSVSYTDEGWEGEPSISERGGEELPTGLTTGYESVRLGAWLSLDTRPIDELSRGGARLGGHIEQHVAFGGLTEGLASSTSRWIRWGGELHLATDVLGRGRVLSIAGYVDLITAIDGSPVPFTELLDAGGQGPIFGFVAGTLRGQSLAAVRVEYIWPVWTFLDATLHVEAGNVFDEHFSDFALERLRLSFGVGVLPRYGGEHIFELSVAAGTEPFVNGAAVTSLRFVAGARNGL